MTDFSDMLSKAKAMQEKMNELQQKVEKEEIEGSSGGGLVKLTLNGKYVATKITIDPSLMKENETDILEDLIIAAINDATKKIAENMNNQLGSISGGIDLPPGMKSPF